MNSTPSDNNQFDFQVDRNIINHVIQSQSSHPADAIVELVQNSYDAGATNCVITLDSVGFSITDDGKGFSSKEEIHAHFGKFGAPHTDDNSNRFGRFRMGRGQIMNLATTKWLSNEFIIDVDIKNRGLSYDLSFATEMDEYCLGCKISGIWYDSFSEYNYGGPLDNILNSIKHKIKYINRIEVVLNGELISLTNYDDWDIINDEYLYKEQNAYGRLHVYNLGVPVESYPDCLKDIKGILVSRKHFKLNTSRSKILEDCPLWKTIYADLRKKKPFKLKKSNLTHSEIQSYFLQVYEGNLGWGDFMELKCFLVHQHSKRYSFNQLAESVNSWAFEPPIEDKHAPMVVDKLLQQYKDIILSFVPFHDIISRYGETAVEDFLVKLFNLVSNDVHETNSSLIKQRQQFFLKRERYSKLRNKVIDQDDSIVEDKDLSVEELVAIRAIRYALTASIKNIDKYTTDSIRKALQRHVFVGTSDKALGWTDGHSYIALERNLLKEIKYGLYGCEKIASVYFHELCHIEGDTNTHDIDFYKMFHDLVIYHGYLSGRKRDSPLSLFTYKMNEYYYQNAPKKKLEISELTRSHVSSKQYLKNHYECNLFYYKDVKVRVFSEHELLNIVHVTNTVRSENYDLLSDKEIINKFEASGLLARLRKGFVMNEKAQFTILSRTWRTLLIMCPEKYGCFHRWEKAFR